MEVSSLANAPTGWRHRGLCISHRHEVGNPPNECGRLATEADMRGEKGKESRYELKMAMTHKSYNFFVVSTQRKWRQADRKREREEERERGKPTSDIIVLSEGRPSGPIMEGEIELYQ